MKNNIHLTIAGITALLFAGIFLVAFCNSNDEHTRLKQRKVLLFSKTNGYRHESIETGIEAIRKLGAANHFSVDVTEDSLDINDKHLDAYQSVIFLSTTGKVLGEQQELALQHFIHKGRGFVGIHAAADCEYNWPWYVKMVGASFESHPKQQTARLLVLDSNHLSCRQLPAVWQRWDEWYNFKSMNPHVKPLIKIDESSYQGGTNGENHPVAWYQDFEGGRVFYTALGHTKESYSEALFLQHILGGIQYSLGLK